MCLEGVESISTPNGVPTDEMLTYHGAMRSLKKLRAILGLPWTPIGRRRIARGILFRSGFLLWPLATLYRRVFLRKTKLIAVTGSFGKTTTTRAVMSALCLPGERHVIWNAGGYLPLALLRTPPASPYCVLEVGISASGQMARYARRIRPDVVVVTAVGSEHIDRLKTLETTRQEKAELVRALGPDGTAALNGDDENVRWMATQTDAPVVTFGLSPGCAVRPDELQLLPEGGARLTVGGSETQIRLKTKLIGRQAVYPVLAGLAVARVLGRSAEAAARGLEGLPAAPERLQMVRLQGGAQAVLDTAKSSLETIDVGMQAVATLDAGRRIAVLGDIEGAPGSQGPIYRDVGRKLGAAFDEIFFVGGRKTFTPLAAGAADAGLPRDHVIRLGRTVAEAIPPLRKAIRAGDVVWIKGRSTQHLARIGLALAGKDVRCHLVYCPVTPGCEICPMLSWGRGPSLSKGGR